MPSEAWTDEDSRVAHKIIDNLSAEAVYDWLQDRLQNARRIAATKSGAERDGWIWDAAYFAAAAAYVVAEGQKDEARALGNALDRWQFLPNDLKSQLETDAPEFVSAMRQLDHLMGQD